MNETGHRRARRWFWMLLLVAVLAMGALYRGLHTAPGPTAGALVGTAVPVLLASGVQAARIWLALAGPPVPPRGWRITRRSPRRRLRRRRRAA